MMYKDCGFRLTFLYPHREVSVLDSGAVGAWVQIAVATLSGNSLRQAVHTHCASVHQAAKLVAAPLRVAGVTAGLAESNGSLRLVYDSRHLQADCQEPGSAPVIEYGLALPFTFTERELFAITM